MLTNPACQNVICPEGKVRHRLPDSGGLYLEVSPAGAKCWFAKYRFGGKEKLLALGSYPDVTLKEARAGRDAARKTRAGGADQVRVQRGDTIARRVSAAVTFKAVTEEFHEAKLGACSEKYAAQFLHCCEIDLFPWIGTLPLADVSAPVLLDALRKVDCRGRDADGA